MEILLILNFSGSMAGLESDTIGGLNSLIKKQKKQRGECFVSKVLFDNVSEVLYDRVKLSEIPKMTERDYLTHGATELNPLLRSDPVFDDRRNCVCGLHHRQSRRIKIALQTLHGGIPIADTAIFLYHFFIFSHSLLTNPNDKSIMHNDNDICQTDKLNCQKGGAVWYCGIA